LNTILYSAVLDRVAMNMYQSTMHEISSQKYINTGFTPRFDNDDAAGAMLTLA